jgi:hypothetical protein
VKPEQAALKGTGKGAALDSTAPEWEDDFARMRGGSKRFEVGSMQDFLDEHKKDPVFQKLGFKPSSQFFYNRTKGAETVLPENKPKRQTLQLETAVRVPPTLTTAKTTPNTQNSSCTLSPDARSFRSSIYQSASPDTERRTQQMIVLTPPRGGSMENCAGGLVQYNQQYTQGANGTSAANAAEWSNYFYETPAAAHNRGSVVYNDAKSMQPQQKMVPSPTRAQASVDNSTRAASCDVVSDPADFYAADPADFFADEEEEPVRAV